MLSPPSLSDQLIARAFHASNGELGILPADAELFLATCATDDIEVLGWELWLVDHRCDPSGSRPVRSIGSWCGLIPTLHGPLPAVVGGSGHRKQTSLEIAALKLPELIDGNWLPFARYNFTLDG